MSVSIPENELFEEPYRPSSGPGGQKVNKTSSGVRLSFRFKESLSLSDEAKERLSVLAGARLVDECVVVVTSHSFRSYERNREEARRKLYELVEKACRTPRKRRPTKATRASCERRLKSKNIRSDVKNSRRRVTDD